MPPPSQVVRVCQNALQEDMDVDDEGGGEGDKIADRGDQVRASLSLSE